MKYLVCLVALVTLNCAGVNPNLCQVQTPGADFTVHSFGDSITAGAGTSPITIGQNTTNSNFCDGYQALFTEGVQGNDDNEAVSGSTLTSNNEIGRIMALNEESENDINTLLPGFNDVSQFGSDPDHLAQFQADLTEGLTHLASMGKITIVGTTLYVSDEMLPTVPLHTNSNVDLYVAVIKQVTNLLQSQGLPIVLVDTNAVYDPNTMSSNNIHPNNDGHRVLANAFLAGLN